MLSTVYCTNINNNIIYNGSHTTVKEVAKNAEQLLTIFECVLRNQDTHRQNFATSHSLLNKIFKLYFLTTRYLPLDIKIKNLIKKEFDSVKNLLDQPGLKDYQARNILHLFLMDKDLASKELGVENVLIKMIPSLSNKSLFKILIKAEGEQNIICQNMAISVLISRILKDPVPVYKTALTLDSYMHLFLSTFKRSLTINSDVNCFNQIYQSTHSIPELHQLCIDHILSQFVNNRADQSYVQAIMENLKQEVAFNHPLLSNLSHVQLTTVISHLSSSCIYLDLSNCKLSLTSFPERQDLYSKPYNHSFVSHKRKALETEEAPSHKRIKMDEGESSTCRTPSQPLDLSIVELLPTNLVSLTITDSLHDEDLAILVNRCPHLNTLSLEGTSSVSNIGWQTLEKLQNLETLVLKDCHISNDIAKMLINNCEKLLNLRLEGSSILVLNTETRDHIKLKMAFRQLCRAKILAPENTQQMIKTYLLSRDAEGNTISHLFSINSEAREFFSLLRRYNYDLFKELLFVKNNQGETPLQFSLKREKLMLLKYIACDQHLLSDLLIEKNIHHQNILHNAASNGNVDISNYLFKFNLLIWERMLSEQDEGGYTPIHICTLNPSMKFFNDCLISNFDLTKHLLFKENKEKKTPLDLALIEMHVEFMEIIFNLDAQLIEQVLLKKLTANVTVFQHCLRTERLDLLNLLYRSSPQTFIKLFSEVNKFNETPLHEIVRDKRVKILGLIAKLDDQLFEKLTLKLMRN